MQAPFAPPRALKPSAAASRARAWSTSEMTGDSKTVISPTTSGALAGSQGPSSQSPSAS